MRPTIGDDVDRITHEIQVLLADVVDPVDVFMLGIDATISSQSTPLWDVLADVASSVHHGAELVPAMLAAWTAASWLRGAGTIAPVTAAQAPHRSASIGQWPPGSSCDHPGRPIIHYGAAAANKSIILRWCLMVRTKRPSEGV